MAGQAQTKTNSKDASKKEARSIVEKIWDSHVVTQLEGHPAIFAIDLMLIHEVTSAQAFQTLDAKGLKVFDPKRCSALSITAFRLEKIVGKFMMNLPRLKWKH